MCTDTREGLSCRHLGNQARSIEVSMCWLGIRIPGLFQTWFPGSGFWAHVLRAIFSLAFLDKEERSLKRHTLSGPRHLVNDAEEYLQEMGGRFVPVPWVSESIRYDGSGSSFILRSGSIAANTPFTLQGIHAMIHKFKLYPPLNHNNNNNFNSLLGFT